MMGYITSVEHISLRLVFAWPIGPGRIHSPFTSLFSGNIWHSHVTLGSLRSREDKISNAKDLLGSIWERTEGGKGKRL